MWISVVSDVHGNDDALKRAADRAARRGRLVILGDLLDYVDYHDPAAGIVGEIFGADAARHFTRLRGAGAFAELHRFNARLWASVDDPHGLLSGVVQERYRAVLAAVGPDALLTLGNVDVAAEWNRVAGDVLPYRDGEVVELDGVRLGFVAGGATRRPRAAATTGSDGRVWRPYVRDWQEYRSAVDAVGPVDILCSHIPPDIPLLRYDVVPARLEMAGPGLIDHIDRHRPALALFGHVHQPLAARTRRGVTECRNVGHFQRSGRALELDLRALSARRAAVPRTGTAVAASGTGR